MVGSAHLLAEAPTPAAVSSLIQRPTHIITRQSEKVQLAASRRAQRGHRNGHTSYNATIMLATSSKCVGMQPGQLDGHTDPMTDKHVLTISCNIRTSTDGHQARPVGRRVPHSITGQMEGHELRAPTQQGAAVRAKSAEQNMQLSPAKAWATTPPQPLSISPPAGPTCYTTASGGGVPVPPWTSQYTTSQPATAPLPGLF